MISAGYELVEFNLPNPNKLAACVFKSLYPDGGEYVINQYKKNIVDSYLNEFVIFLKVKQIFFLPGFFEDLFFFYYYLDAINF